MKTKYYVLRIELLNVRQPVWREVVVPSNILLSDLSEVIQIAMGWPSESLAIFEFKGQVFESLRFAKSSFERPQEVTELNTVLKRARQKLTYTCSLADHWSHSVVLKKALPWDGIISLTCSDGEGSTSLMDTGGRVDLDPINTDLQELAEELEEEEGDFEMQAIFDHLEGKTGAGVFDELYAASEGLDELEDEVEDEFVEPYTDLDEYERSQFREAMNQAETLREYEPWKDLWDQDIFCIKDPATGLLDFISILGRGGEVYALHVHHGIEGYHLWLKVMLGTLPMDDLEAYMRALRLIEVEFVNKAQMEPVDFKLYEQTSYEVPSRGSQRWVRFRRYHPRAGAAWFPDAEDLPRLTRAMRLCRKYIELCRSEPDSKRSKYRHQGRVEGEPAATLPCFTLSGRATEDALSAEDLSAWSFSHEPIDWQEADAECEIFEPLEFELQQFANLGQVDEIWELGAAYLQKPVGTPQGPVLPILGVAVPLDESVEGPPVPYMGTTLEMTPAAAVWRALLQSALARECRPYEVDVTTALAEETLKPIEALCGTKIVRQERFQQLDELLNMMSRF
jgi:hypothetical protein